MNWRGDWDGSRSYRDGDLIRYYDAFYVMGNGSWMLASPELAKAAIPAHDLQAMGMTVSSFCPECSDARCAFQDYLCAECRRQLDRAIG